MSPEIIAQLAPTGVLRAGINLSNFLLVTGRDEHGSPQGVAPDMARAVAERLGVPLRLVPYRQPGLLADAVGTDSWDIGLIGAEPQRAEKIAFTAAYAEIEATYLVPAGSPITSMAEVDRAGVRIASTARAAYDLWLERNVRHATLLRADSIDGAFLLCHLDDTYLYHLGATSLHKQERSPIASRADRVVGRGKRCLRRPELHPSSRRAGVPG